MKIGVGITIGVMLGLVVLGVGLFFAVTHVANSFSDESQENGTAAVPTGTATPPPTSNFAVTQPPAAATTTPRSTGFPVATITRTQPSAPSVTLGLNIPSFSISGATSATVDAQIVNSGSGDAHNAYAVVQVYCQGTLVKIANQDSYRKDIGTIAAGATIDTQAILSVNLIDGMKILSNGAIIQLTVVSTEVTKSYSYNFKP